MSNSTSLAFSSSPTIKEEDIQKFLGACRDGNLDLFKEMIDDNDRILPSTTPHKNNCLHITAMLGHDSFVDEVWSRDRSLFSCTNIDGETPLIAALMAANEKFASKIIRDYGRSLNPMFLKVDRRNENALHHALRNGFVTLAHDLLGRDKRLSEQVSKTGESPMFMAARKGYAAFVDELLTIPTSADQGTISGSALHAAVRFNYPDIARNLLQVRPQLAERQDTMGMTPLQRAINHDNIEMVRILLESNPKLAYIRNEKTENTPFIIAAEFGAVSIAKEIMRTCPDSTYTPNKDGHNALHVAIKNEKPDFVNYILKTPRLQRLVNQADIDGNLPLHQAATKCDPKLIRSLLIYPRIDKTAVNIFSYTAVYYAIIQANLSKTLKWNESFTLLANLNPFGLRHYSIIRAKKYMEMKVNAEIKPRTEKYTSNASLVAALLATITFATAFTLPGGFTGDGHPFFASNRAFQAFLISGTIAMCCSLTVAFLCILVEWEDMDFLLNYRKTTRVLMWCAYEATGIAFGTGLYTVLMPHHNRLAFPILVLCVILPIISMFIANWPFIMLRIRLGRLYQSDLVPNI